MLKRSICNVKNVNSKSHKLIIVNKLGVFCLPFSYIEIVKRKVNWESLIKLAKLFNVTPEYILSTEEKETIISKDILKKNNMAFFGSDDISDEDKKEILDKLNEFYYKNKK